MTYRAKRTFNKRFEFGPGKCIPQEIGARDACDAPKPLCAYCVGENQAGAR